MHVMMVVDADGAERHWKRAYHSHGVRRLGTDAFESADRVSLMP